MKERPILFQGAMVRALLDGSKTQTRRIIKPQPGEYWSPVVGLYNPIVIKNGGYEAPGPEIFGAFDETEGRKNPYGQPGDRLWVREVWSPIQSASYDDGQSHECALYRADTTIPATHQPRWKPSIHMPRWASRILLEVVSVRIERLQDISSADAFAEGIKIPYDDTGSPLVSIAGPMSVAKFLPDSKLATVDDLARAEYAALWESINGTGSWDDNPWIWVVEFKRVQP